MGIQSYGGQTGKRLAHARRQVVVYSGILPVTRDENGLAVVLGLEIAHAVTNHGGERMSQALLVEMGGLTLDAALSQNETKTNGLFLAA